MTMTCGPKLAGSWDPFVPGGTVYRCTCTCTGYSRLVRRDVFAFEPSIGHSRRGTLPWPLRRRVRS